MGTFVVRLFTWVALGSIVFPTSVVAQQVFHSTQSANLQTTETLNGGNLLFEISHRFLPPVSAGADALWGLDGPVYNRLSLSWAPTDAIVLGILRSNHEDNLEIDAKARVLEAVGEGFTLALGVMAGIAWNMDPLPGPGTEEAEDNESQFYAQAIANALLGETVAVGVVPTWLRNPRILDAEPDNAFAVGVHGQWYFSDVFSLLGEWIFSEERPGMEYDSGSFGVEIETRGHFFKLLVTNQPRMNPTQYLGGAPNPFEMDELRLGFNITRLLPF